MASSIASELLQRIGHCTDPIVIAVPLGKGVLLDKSRTEALLRKRLKAELRPATEAAAAEPVEEEDAVLPVPAPPVPRAELFIPRSTAAFLSTSKKSERERP